MLLLLPLRVLLRVLLLFLQQQCFVPAAAVLLLPAAVRHRVLPDDKFCCWFVESDPSVFFLFIQTRFLFDVPLGSTVAFTASICLHSR